MTHQGDGRSARRPIPASAARSSRRSRRAGSPRRRPASGLRRCGLAMTPSASFHDARRNWPLPFAPVRISGYRQPVVAVDAAGEAADLGADEAVGDAVAAAAVDLGDLALLDRDEQAAGVRAIQRARRVDGAPPPVQFLAHPISLPCRSGTWAGRSYDRWWPCPTRPCPSLRRPSLTSSSSAAASAA